VLVATVLSSLGLISAVSGMAWIAGLLLAIVGLALLIALATKRGRRMVRREATALQRVFSEPRRAIVIVASSLVVVAALVAIFVIAALAAGLTAAPGTLIALALVALSAAALPFNVGGWGPREAAAASTFALVGLGPDAGVAASTAFGVLTLIAVSPGALVFIADRITVAPRPTIPEETAA
jgi:uncharacterized membrane protein YbhN (UPF0104 family)